MPDIDFTPEGEEGDDSGTLPPPTGVSFEFGAVIFPFGAAAFAAEMMSRGVRCDAIHVDDEGGLLLYDADKRDWIDAIAEDKPTASVVTAIGSKRQQ